MSQTELEHQRTRSKENHPAGANTYRGQEGTNAQVSPDAVATALADDYSRQIVELLSDDAATGPELAEQMNASEATVYRRLNQLEDAGLVSSSLRIRSDGNHTHQYKLSVKQLEFQLGAGSVQLTAHGH